MYVNTKNIADAPGIFKVEQKVNSSGSEFSGSTNLWLKCPAAVFSWRVWRTLDTRFF